jgi:hypothetical protein
MRLTMPGALANVWTTKNPATPGMPTMRPPQRTLAKTQLEPWERNGTVILACKKCDYHGEVPWDPVACESGQWRCPQCDLLWPFLDFDHLWIAPCRTIEYRGSIDLTVPVSGGFSAPTTKIRVWRQCDDDPSPFYIHTDPERPEEDDFYWGLCRYSAERIPSLNLAYAILYDFYGWLSWADFQITDAPYSQKGWAQEHAPAFLDHTIARLPDRRPWSLSDADMQSALRQIVPASFPTP